MRTSNLQWNVPVRATALAATVPGAAVAHSEITLDPPLAPRDEAIFLLHVAAEIEHALLVQYLYAAYSLRRDGDFGPGAPANAAALTQSWFNAIFQTAKEEMGHLLTVQNILRFIGGPLTLEREDFPFRSDVYPFHFRLQPLTKNSLAKYVAAERPEIPVGLSPEEEATLDQLLARVHHADAEPVNRVGRVYNRLIELAEKLTVDDFRPDLSMFQGTAGEWGGDPETLVQRDAAGNIISVGKGVLVFQVKNGKDLVDALTAVGLQGEGGATAATNRDSHFWRFFSVYRDADFPDEAAPPMKWQPARAVAVNPNTTTAPTRLAALYAEEREEETELAKGRITNEQTRLWAQIFNTRYRLLLLCLGHSLRVPATDPNRSRLINWAGTEMHNVAHLATLLSDMDRTAHPKDGKAGATFELPYTLSASDDDRDRWRTQRDLLIAAALLYQNIHPANALQTEKINALRTDDGVDEKSGRRKIVADILQTPLPLPGVPGRMPVPVGAAASFARDILPLFRTIDIEHMTPMGVMLGDFHYMSDPGNAQQVLDTLAGQTMPPGGPFWSQTQLDLFRKWMADGFPV